MGQSYLERSSDHLRSLKHIFLLQVMRLPTGPDVQRFHPSRRCAFSLSFPYPPSIIQSMSFCLSLPILSFPPSFPLLTPSVESCLLECVLSSIGIKFPEKFSTACDSNERNWLPRSPCRERL